MIGARRRYSMAARSSRSSRSGARSCLAGVGVREAVDGAGACKVAGTHAGDRRGGDGLCLVGLPGPRATSRASCGWTRAARAGATRNSNGGAKGGAVKTRRHSLQPQPSNDTGSALRRIAELASEAGVTCAFRPRDRKKEWCTAQGKQAPETDTDLAVVLGGDGTISPSREFASTGGGFASTSVDRLRPPSSRGSSKTASGETGGERGMELPAWSSPPHGRERGRERPPSTAARRTWPSAYSFRTRSRRVLRRLWCRPGRLQGYNLANGGPVLAWGGRARGVLIARTRSPRVD